MVAIKIWKTLQKLRMCYLIICWLFNILFSILLCPTNLTVRFYRKIGEKRWPTKEISPAKFHITVGLGWTVIFFFLTMIFNLVNYKSLFTTKGYLNWIVGITSFGVFRNYISTIWNPIFNSKTIGSPQMSEVLTQRL